MLVRVLCIGDVVGKPGRKILSEHLPRLIEERQIHCVVANGENAAGGSGITAPMCEKLHSYGVDVITLGDHAFRRREGLTAIAEGKGIIRPANFAREAAGKGCVVQSLGCGVEVAVINVVGRMYMRSQADCPFHAVDACLKTLDPSVKIRIVDIHGEVTSEKIAMGWHLSGLVSIVFGTHTHVATADERILPGGGGTAYITDLGMTGPHESVLGRKTDRVLKALTTNMPSLFEVASGDVRINGIVVEVDSQSGKASKIERICVSEDDSGNAPM